MNNFHIAVFCVEQPERDNDYSSRSLMEYKGHSIEVLTHYFKKNKYDFTFIKDIEDKNYKNAHISWCKLLSHKFINSYFILCWDLDLLPKTPIENIKTAIDFNKINLARDSSLLIGGLPYNENFKYNGGLFGIPKAYQVFAEEIYNKFAPGSRPSYEQYYLNDELANQNISVNVLPQEYNTFYLPDNHILIKNAKCVHFGWKHCVPKAKYIEEHHKNYFENINNDNDLQ